MIGVGAAITAAGAIYGGLSASRTAKEVAADIETRREKSKEWYNRRYNEDATHRADAQRVLTMTEESIKKRNNAAAGTVAVMGGSTDAVEAAKAANNAAIADTASQIAAGAEARKDNIEATYLQNDNAYAEQLAQMEREKTKAIAGAVQGVATAGAKMAGL